MNSHVLSVNVLSSLPPLVHHHGRQILCYCFPWTSWRATIPYIAIDIEVKQCGCGSHDSFLVDQPNDGLFDKRTHPWGVLVNPSASELGSLTLCNCNSSKYYKLPLSFISRFRALIPHIYSFRIRKRHLNYTQQTRTHNQASIKQIT